MDRALQQQESALVLLDKKRRYLLAKVDDGSAAAWEIQKSEFGLPRFRWILGVILPMIGCHDEELVYCQSVLSVDSRRQR